MERCLFCAFLCEGHGQIDCRCGLTWAAAQHPFETQAQAGAEARP